MLIHDTRSRVDGYWTGFFRCAREQLRSAEPVVLAPAAELSDYEGVYLQSFGEAPVLSVPRSLVNGYGPALARAAQGGLAADGRWAEALGSLLGTIIGPAWIGYADARTLRPVPVSAETRELTDSDLPLVERLRDACTPTEWSHAGGDGGELAVGVFAGGELASLARIQDWGSGIAHVSIVTHPELRGRGSGREAVAALSRMVLERGMIPQYRTLDANAASRSVAAALGFQHYATSLALRLAPAPRTGREGGS